MLTFLKKLFHQEGPKKAKQLTLKELEEWLRTEESKEKEKLARRIAEFHEEFKETKEGMERHLEQLQQATLQNTNIPAKAFHFMEGNRESYIRFIRQFLGTVSDFPKEAEDIGKYCEEFTGYLNHFASVSQRNYFVLQNFFANTLKDIGQFLKALEESVKRLETGFEESRLSSVQEIKNKLAHLHEKEAYKKKLEHDAKEAEKSLHQASVDLAQAKERLSALENGEEWKRMKELGQKLALAKEGARAEEQKISMLFSPLEKALKKYAKEAFDNQKLTEKYGEGPAQALEHDSQLHIISIFEKLKQSLAKNGLGLDEKRIHKANIALESLTKEVLHEHQQALKKQREKIAQLEEEIASSSLQEKHESQKKALEIAQEEHERKKQALETLKGKIGGIDEKKMMQELETSIVQKLGEHISVLEEEQ